MQVWPDAPPWEQEHPESALHLESEQGHPVWESPPEWERQAWALRLESEQVRQGLALNQLTGVDL
jgi:hypothetical protein